MGKSMLVERVTSERLVLTGMAFSMAGGDFEALFYQFRSCHHGFSMSVSHLKFGWRRHSVYSKVSKRREEVAETRAPIGVQIFRSRDFLIRKLLVLASITNLIDLDADKPHIKVCFISFAYFLGFHGSWSTLAPCEFYIRGFNVVQKTYQGFATSASTTTAQRMPCVINRISQLETNSRHIRFVVNQPLAPGCFIFPPLYQFLRSCHNSTSVHQNVFLNVWTTTITR